MSLAHGLKVGCQPVPERFGPAAVRVTGLVSVVTPCLDSARFIRATVDSVASQDYPHIEHIVMDGGSTDGTLEILEGLSGLTVYSGQDRGTASAINRGFECSRGEYLLYLNAD